MAKIAIYSSIIAMVLAACDSMREETNVRTSSNLDQQIIDQEAENDRETNLQ